MHPVDNLFGNRDQRRRAKAGVAIRFIPNKGEAYLRDDAAFFASNPTRAHRLRRSFPNETVMGELMPWVAICGRGPCGTRMRIGFDFTPEPSDDGEPLARAVFGALLEALDAGRDEIDPADIAERARIYARRGL